MDIGFGELIVIFVVVLLLFGVGRISKIAGELGRSVRAFREGLRGEDEQTASNPAADDRPTDESA